MKTIDELQALSTEERKEYLIAKLCKQLGIRSSDVEIRYIDDDMSRWAELIVRFPGGLTISWIPYCVERYKFIFCRADYDPESESDEISNICIDSTDGAILTGIYAVRLVDRVRQLEDALAKLREENAELRLLPGAPDHLEAKKHYEQLASESQSK